ncbi:MAG: alanine--tRNA ligase [Dehalococcoidales bacterium]
MNSDEIRTAFLKFFEEKGHKVIPGSSLIPKDDPTLLLTTAGMVQIKPYFLGEAEPPSRRLASCQKCFRTTDIESVGDDRHLTFFEMLGNFSVGDYFKKEAIAWAWEFFTERMEISPEKLWITIYLDDEEAFKYWREVGVPAEKIVRCGENDNFWGPAGNSGPCGPCSEIHYDFGLENGCGRADCQPNCECGRFKEIWNLVFTQYDQDEKGHRAPLPKPNIDTGMGLERIVMVIAGEDSVYETDVFATLLDRVAALTGKKYGFDKNDDNAMRVVAEHGRALAFLIADGVLPDNEGRGYVLRRLLRRGALFGRRLGLDKPFLAEIAKTAIKKMGHVYPELKQRQDFIVKVIEMEESRFEETLNTGLAIIDEILSKKAGKKAGQISGIDAFKLYDTYGFPIELTKEIVKKSGFTVDMAAFDKEMEKQRERARASHKFDTAAGSGAGLAKLNIKATEFTGYTCFEQKSKIVKLLVDGVEAEKIGVGQKAGVILDTTPFYAEMGGQVGDTGEINGAKGKFTVTDTVRITPEVVLHQGEVTAGTLASGEEVQAMVDMERRLDIARNHTATHLLQAALRQVLGGHIQQRGSLVSPERLRFDFSHLAAMTPGEIKSVQRIVNERIRQNLKVAAEETAYKKAVESGATALFDEKYGDIVRVMRIGAPAVSAELCGGTHISSTGEIGYFQIISEGSIGAGLRRIEAVTGRGAEAFIDKRLSSLESLAQSLEVSPEEVGSKLADLLSKMDRESKLAKSLEREITKGEAKSLLDKVEVINGINVLSARVSSSNMQVMREMADFIKDKLKSGIIILGALKEDGAVFVASITSDLQEKGYSAKDIINDISKVTNGRGGGRVDFAQAGGRDKSKLDEALRLVKSLIK